MQTKLTKLAIAAYSSVLKAEGADKASESLMEFGSIFYGYANKQLDVFLDAVAKLELSRVLEVKSTGEAKDRSISQVIESLRNLEQFLEQTSSRTRSKDVAKLRKVFKRYESATIGQLKLALQSQRRPPRKPKTLPGSTNHLMQLANNLKAALGRSVQFRPLFDELNSLDAKGVAKVTDTLMSGGSSSSRKHDLTRIRERHEAQEANFAKRRATAGSSAA